MRSLILITLSLMILSACGTTSRSTIKLSTASNYSTDGWLTAVKKEENKQTIKKETGIVFLHGKRGDPDTSHNADFISKMSEMGYEIIAPLMPWSERRGYNGTREQGMDVITAAVNALDTKKVVVIGHSMGAMAVLQYGASGPAAKVAGLISIAPGHDPNNAYKLQSLTSDGAAKACDMVENGKGKERSKFTDMNGGRKYSINATAEYYCTHYSVRNYPDSQRIAGKIKTPLFILSGDDDRLTQVYSHGMIFRALPANNKNKFVSLPGGHLSVLYKHTDKVSGWIDAL